VEHLKDFYQNQGETGIQGSRDAIRLAFERGLIAEGSQWMEMIKSRTLKPHAYRRDTAHLIAGQILTNYHPLLIHLLVNVEQERNKR